MDDTASSTNRIKTFILVAVISVLLMVNLTSCFHCGDIVMTDYHPFKSLEAKNEYLRANEERSRVWPVPFESVYAETSYGKTYVRVNGPKDGPSLVMLPGKGSNSLMWHKVIGSLSQRYRTYALDPPFEYGLSVSSRTMKNCDELVGWLNELFVGLNLRDNINLMGLSYGGWLTALYASRHPERLRKAVLIAPAATILPIKSQFSIRYALMTALPFRYFRESFFLWLYEDLAVQGEAGRSYIEKIVDENERDSRLFKSRPDAVLPTVLGDCELLSIKVPVLFIVGEREKIYSAHEAVERAKRVVPMIKTAIISDSGHDLIFCQPELVDKAVIEFLE